MTRDEKIQQTMDVISNELAAIDADGHESTNIFVSFLIHSLKAGLEHTNDKEYIEGLIDESFRCVKKEVLGESE